TFVHHDFERFARETRSVISATLFGALAAAGALPFSRAQFEDAIRRVGVGVESSLAGFAAAFKTTLEPSTAHSDNKTQPKPKVGSKLRSLAARIEEKFPPPSHTILFAAIQKLADYQDISYASAYLDELTPIRDADAIKGAGDFALLCETARYLALWMT